MNYALTLILCLSILSIAQAQTASLPNYPLHFTYRTDSGANRDTVLSWASLTIGGGSTGSLSYLKWIDAPYGLKSTSLGLKLCVDSFTSFSSGQSVGWAFFKIRSLGKFDMDYIKSNLWQFIDDSQSPNLQPVLTSDGVQLNAIGNIAPNSVLTVSYSAFRALFPGDQTVHLRIRRF